MAEDDDDDDLFPPQIERLPTEFSFRLVGSIQIDGTEWDKTSTYRRSFLAISNIYGLVFVIEKDGFMVYDSDLLLQNAKSNSTAKPFVHVPLKYSAHWVDISSDNLTLVVCCGTGNGLSLLFFDTRNLINKAKPAKTPFAIFQLSKAPGIRVSGLHWNPAVGDTRYLAVCLSSGSLHMLSVTETIQELAQKPEDFGAFSVCWSPRGKQIMVGKRDGSLQQFTPNLEIRRTVAVCPAIDRPVGVCDVLWLSTLEVATTFVATTAEGEEEDNQANLFLTNLPPAREKNKDAAWRNYEDPCYGGNTILQSAHFHKTYVDKWNMFVIASSNASETGLIAKDSKTDIWEIWTLDDSSRGDIPMISESDDPFPLGVGVIYNGQDHIVVDDTRECGPMPIYAILSSEGYLSFFHMINLLSSEEYPSLTYSKKELSASGERVTDTSQMAQRELATKSLSGAKLKLASKPSAVATSTPRRISSPGMGNVLQPNMSPVVGKMNQITDQTNPVVPISFLPPKQSIGQAVNRMPLAVSAPKSNIPPYEKAAPPLTAGLRSNIEATESPKRKPASSISKVRERLNSIPNSDDDVIAASLRSEISNFENDLSNFISEGAGLLRDVESLGTEDNQKQWHDKTNNHESFTKEIVNITAEQHKEIQGAQQAALETYAALQNVISHKQKTEHKDYWEALKSRPLDLEDQRNMKEIRGLYQYVGDAIRETDATLDDQWHKHITTNKSTSLRKSKRREHMEERNAVVKAISNQTKILHNQEVNVLLLGQMMDRLKLLNTVACQSPNTSLLSSRRKTQRPDADSDLETMATSIIETKKIMRPNPDHDTTPTTANQRSPFSSISPKKSSQLAHMLSSRRRAPVRPALGGKTKSSFIPVPRRNLSKKTPPGSTPVTPARKSSVASKSSQFSTNTESYTETDFETDEAGVESSDSNTYSQQFKNVPQAKFNNQPENTPVLPKNGPQIPKPLAFSMSSSPFTTIPLKTGQATGYHLFGATPSQPVANKPSTILYGAPDNSVQSRPATKFDPRITSHAEATSNLNNPPTVVNIKELKEPAVMNVVPFSAKFNAKPDVPPGAAAVVQNILNTVVAEKQQGSKGGCLPTQPVQGQLKSVDLTGSENKAFSPVANHAKSSSGNSIGDETNLGGTPIFRVSRSKVAPSPLTVSNNDPGEMKDDTPTPLFGKNPNNIPVLFGRAPTFSDNLPKVSTASSVGFGQFSTMPGLGFSSISQDPSQSKSQSSLAQALSGKPPPLSRGDVGTKPDPTSEAEKAETKTDTENTNSQQSKPCQDTTSPEVTTSVAAQEVSNAATEPKNVVATITSPSETPGGGLLEQESKPAPVKSLFGQKTDSKSVGGLFGLKTGPTESAETSNKTTPGASLFGQPIPNKSSTGLFGQTTNKETSAAETATKGPFDQPGLFGTPTTKPSTGLFGQSTTDKPSNAGLFGQPTSGLVGQDKTQSSTGLFGQNPSTLSSSGLFGQTPATKPSTGLFGQTPNTQPSSGLFSQTPPSKPSTGLFGQPATPSTGVFGKPPAATQASTGSFGQSTTNQTSGLFGQPSESTSGFGQTPGATQPSTGLFGQAAESTGGFGHPSKSTGLFGQATSTQTTASPFVQTPSSQSGAFQTNSGFKTPAAQTGGGFMGGLGSKPAPTNVNPFSSQPSQGATDSTSLFGSGSRPFGSPSGNQFGAASTASSFNSFSKPAGDTSPFSSGGGAFGSAPVFGGATNAFMAKGGFGQPATFGSNSFGAGSNTSGGFGSPAVFGSPASPNVDTGSGHVFGQAQSSSFPSPGFGAGQQSAGFGDLAGNQGGGFGASNFGTSQKPAFSSWR